MLDNLFTPVHLLILLPLLMLYFAPSWLAWRRDATHYEWIAVANLLVGATVVGWVIVLIWALYDRPRAALA